MKLRKLFAWLMTLVMLLGMVPAGHAEVIACDHHWAWRWPDGQPTNCQDWKWSEEYCTLCGEGNGRFEQCGPCQPGSWHWDGNPPANCNEWGIQNQSCSVCGEVFNEREVRGDHQWGGYTTVEPAGCETPGEEVSNCSVCGERGSSREIPAKGHDWGEWKWEVEATCNKEGLRVRYCKRCNMRDEDYVQGGEHQWGEWITTVEPTCMEQGRHHHTCQRCGATMWEYMPKANHVFGEWRVIEEPQVGIPGTERRACIYGCGTHEDREIPALEEALSAVGLELTLVLSSTPANGTHFVVGEEVTFAETWVNNTDKTLYPFSVSIWTCGTPVFGSEIDQICSWFAEDAGGPVAPGASGSHTLTVTVTEADVARGAIYATAELLSTVENGPDLENVTTPFVTAPCGPDNSGDFGLVNGLTVTKQVTSTPANGSYYEPGEDITFVITVSNQGREQLLNVNVIDPLGGGLVTVLETLNIGETKDITVVFTTTDIVAWAGSVDNGACVKAVDKDGRQYVEYSNIVTVPCGHTFLDVTITPDNPFGIFHSVAVVKTEESLPMNGEFYTVGEVIHYAITYTNDGELPLTDVQVWDVMNVTAPIASAEMLQPGESRTCYYQHTVTPEDVASGSVINVAHASYPVPNAAGFANSCSNVVISKTDAYDWVWVTPLFPESGEDPEYDPGTGWFPDGDPIPEGETPPFGTIDTDTLHGGDSYCMRTITGRDNVSASYETTFCAVHSPVQSSVLMMSQAAVTPEMQVQSAAYAAALWRSEAEALYQQIIGAADPTATAVVMTEFVRFMTEVANYEVLLKGLYPDQPALVATKVAAMWENKCIDLCCEMHAAAAERKDSLLAVSPANGAVAEKCACELTAQEAGKETSVQRYCPVHGFPFSMIDALLQGSDTAEAWTMVRQIWGVELTNSYNKVYTALGDNKLLAMAEYNALTQWMMAREATLIALYPSHPEVVAQTMVKIIMDRVNDLCQAIQ